MKIIIEGSIDEIPEIANGLLNRSLRKDSRNVKYVSEDDLRKTVGILSDYFKKHNKVEAFGYMSDTELSAFVERVLSK